MRLPEPPEGILDPQNPWHLPMPKSPGLWGTLKARLTGRPNEYGDYSSYVNITEADADRLIANMKKDPRGYPQLDQTSGTPAQWMERQRIYQEWLVEEYLERPFREETDNKIEEAAIERRLNEIQEEKKKKVEQAVELTTEVVEETVLEEPDVPMVVPTTELIPSPKKPEQEEQKPEKTRKKRSSLLGSMLKTFTRMENHFQKLIELTESSEADMVVISDAFKMQGDALTRGFQETTTLVTRVTQAVDLQSSTMVRIAKGKKDLDQKRLDAQQALNEEIAMEQQQSTASNARTKDIDKGGPGTGGGIGGAITKVLGGAVIGKFIAGKGLKLAQGGGKIASKLTSKALEKAVGKDVAETVFKNAGREAAEAGVEKGAAKLIGKRIPLVGLGLGTFFALERAAKGDFLGAGLELASGAASTIPGAGTAGSLAIDAALLARDTGALPFAKGGLTQRSTFSNKRPGVTDLSPDLFKKMYQYELDYEARNKLKFGRLYADGYQKYFDSPGLLSKLSGFLSNIVDFFKNIAGKIASGLGRGARNLLETFNPRTGTTTNEFREVLPEGNPQLTSRFGPRVVSWGSKNHQGIDIGVDAGSRVVALEDGIVKDIYEDFGGHGQAVVIDHGDGTRNVYGHVDAKVRIGDTIKKGNVIATVKYWPGSGAQPTDNTHLHLERRTGPAFKPIDPAQYLNERAEKSKPKPESKPTSSAPGDTRRTYASQQITQNFGQPVGTRVTFPYKNENNYYNAYKTTTGWDLYAGRTKLDTSNGKNAGALQAFLDYADVNLVRDAGGTSPELTGTDFSPEGRAKGGPVIANTPYMVGEKGPEMFMPKQDGFVINNQQTAGLVDFIDNMVFGSGKKGPSTLKYGDGYTAPRKSRGWAADESGAEILRTLGGTPVRGAMMENQLNKLVAMAPLEEQMTTSVQVIRVNNTNTIPIAAPEDTSDGAASAGNIFKDLHLASIS